MNLFEYIIGSRWANREQRHLATLLTRQLEMEHPEVVQSIRRRRLITWLIVLGGLLGFGFIAAIQEPTPQAKHSPKKKRARKSVAPIAPDAPEVAPEAPSPEPQ